MNDLIFSRNIRDNDFLRAGLNALAFEIFGLSFEQWHQCGYWTDKYIPHVFHNGQKVIANVSVNLIETSCHGKPCRYVQLGTIMTDSGFRHKGLSRRLMEMVLDEWQSRCDGIYLFANDTVLDFYPKFGFNRVKEYQYVMPFKGSAGKIQKLDMAKDEDVEILKGLYKRGNPFSAFSVINNFELLMFYCGGFLKDRIYYSSYLETAVIADFENVAMICYDIYADEGSALRDVLAAAAEQNFDSVIFGFTPKDISGMVVGEVKSDDALFLRNWKSDIFNANKLMFPLLSHA